MKEENKAAQNKGYIYAILAFLFWGGVSPLYFKEVASVSPLEVLMHRAVWSFVMLMPLLVFTKELKNFFATLRNLRSLKYLFLSTLLVSFNWLLFIWAVANDKILEASLGYYINPLVNVLLGFVFFQERMSKNQYIAIFISFIAVIYQLFSLGTIPIVSLMLAFSFGFYGMIRKKINVGSLVGLSIETLMLMPFALVYLIYLVNDNSLAFISQSSYIMFMLTLGGVVTITPLLLFNGAATRMKLTTLGFFQYIGPTCAFLIAIFIYDEAFTQEKMITFVLIWIALIIFSMDALIKKRR